jgi:hypothetical protein
MSFASSKRHVAIRTAGGNHWVPNHNNREDLSVLTLLITDAITDFWQVIRYTAEGPTLLAVYGGADAERRARASGFHRYAGASIVHAPWLKDYRSALRAVDREVHRTYRENHMDRKFSREEQYELKRCKKALRFYAAIAAAVRDEPGMTIAEAVNAVDHHYADDRVARSHVRSMLSRGVGMEGIKAEWNEDGSECRLWPRESEENNE